MLLRHRHGSILAMKGVIELIEKFGRVDTRMTEKNYAHLSPSYFANTIRAHFPTLGITGDTNAIKSTQVPQLR